MAAFSCCLLDLTNLEQRRVEIYVSFILYIDCDRVTDWISGFPWLNEQWVSYPPPWVEVKQCNETTVNVLLPPVPRVCPLLVNKKRESGSPQSFFKIQKSHSCSKDEGNCFHTSNRFISYDYVWRKHCLVNARINMQLKVVAVTWFYHIKVFYLSEIFIMISLCFHKCLAYKNAAVYNL